MNTGEAIRYYRKKKKLTQEELAKLCGTSSGMIRQYELGLRNPKIETIEKIAQALSVKIIDIYPITPDEWVKTEQSKNIMRNNNSQYVIIKLLEVMYTRAETVSWMGCQNNDIYSSDSYISIGVGDHRLAIDYNTFNKIVALCTNQLKDIVELVAKNEISFLSDLQDENSNLELSFSEDEHITVTVEDKFLPSLSRSF